MWQHQGCHILFISIPSVFSWYINGDQLQWCQSADATDEVGEAFIFRIRETYNYVSKVILTRKNANYSLISQEAVETDLASSGLAEENYSGTVGNAV